MELVSNGLGVAVATQATATVDVKAHSVKKSSMTGNWLADAVMVVENMTQSECLVQLPNLANQSDRSWYTIGGILTQIQRNQWWSIKGYTSFNSFVENELNIPAKRATSWIRIYTQLCTLGIKMDELDSVGWTKLKAAVPYLNKENKDELLGLARTMSTSSFEIYLQGLAGKNKKTRTATGGSDTNSQQFKLMMHEDQLEVVNAALERARVGQQTEHNAVALTSICEQYMSGNSGGGHVGRGALILALQEMGDDGVAEVLTSAFPHLDIQISEQKTFDPLALGGEGL